MKSDLYEIIKLFQQGKIEESKIKCENIIQSEINNSEVFNVYAFILYQQGKFEDALNNWQNAIKINPNYIEAYNGIGNAYKKLNHLNKAITNFKKAIEINPNYLEARLNLSNVLMQSENFNQAIKTFNDVIKIDSNNIDAYYGKALALHKLFKSKEAIEIYEKALSINKNHPTIYNDMGVSYLQLKNWEEAANCFVKSFDLDPNNKNAFINLVNLLTFYRPKKINSNSIIKTNDLLAKINFKYSPDKKITDDEIIEFYFKINKVLQDNFVDNNFENEQIFRRNQIDLNCKRHFKVFNRFNVIPKFCFNCYKIVISPKNIIELFKTYIVFDNLKLKKNNIRKCIIELRPNTEGVYKGLIYCAGLEEAKEIFNYVKPILDKSVNSNLSVIIKRGCTEFAKSFPDYKKIDSSMKYNSSWEEKEKIVDKENFEQNKESDVILENTIPGLNISDALVIKNWLIYSKNIDDESFKKFKINISDSEYMRKKFLGQVDFRKNEFKKLNLNI